MKHYTSIPVSKRLHFYFRDLQLFQKITISIIILCILENYNHPFKAKTTRTKKWKPKKEKIGEKRYSIRNRT